MFFEIFKNNFSGLTDLLDQFHEGVLIVDNQGIIKFVNNKYAEFLGIDRKRIIGVPMEKIFPGTRVYHVLRGGEDELNQIYRFEDGREVIAHRILLKTDGKIIGVLLQIWYKEISDLRKLAAKLGILEAKVKHAERELDKYVSTSQYTFDNIIADDECLIEAKNLALRGAKSFSSMFLLEGESGTGKELFAHAIHHASPRKSGPFIRINCAAIPYQLLESELFGYEKGAFTDAETKGKPGKFELAHEGTIFLDEIGEMPLSMQPKILRVLEDREVTRLGATKPKKFVFACIAATNNNLEKMVQEKRFRLDLYHRLNIVHIDIPPLRNLPKTLPFLCQEIITKKCRELGQESISISQEVLDLFREYNWPGNVRELNNVVESAINMCDGRMIQITDLPKRMVSSFQTGAGSVMDTAFNRSKLTEFVMQMEKEKIQKVLIQTNYNISEAANQLGIHRTWLYNKIRKYALIIPRYQEFRKSAQNRKRKVGGIDRSSD